MPDEAGRARRLGRRLARPRPRAPESGRGRRLWPGAPASSLEREGDPFRAVEDVLGPEGLAAAAAAARTWARVWGRLPLVDGKSFRELVEWRGASLLWCAEAFLRDETAGPRCAQDGRDRPAPPRGDDPGRGGRARPRPRRRAPPRARLHRAGRPVPRPGPGPGTAPRGRSTRPPGRPEESDRRRPRPRPPAAASRPAGGRGRGRGPARRSLAGEEERRALRRCWRPCPRTSGAASRP